MVRNLLLANLVIHGFQGRHDIIRQWALLNRVQVGLQLLRARSANNNRVSVRLAKDAMVRRPPKCRSVAANSILGRDFERLVSGGCDGRVQVELGVYSTYVQL
jgi:hypothetical protein